MEIAGQDPAAGRWFVRGRAARCLARPGGPRPFRGLFLFWLTEDRLMPDLPRPLKTIGEPGPGKGPVLFQAMTACDCGCGRKDRFEFRIGRNEISIDDPDAIRCLIAEMQAGFDLLWPAPPGDQPDA